MARLGVTAKTVTAIRMTRKKVEAVSAPNRPLTLNLIPKTMWGKNVRAVVSQTIWANLRWGYGATNYMRERLEIDFPEEILTQRRDYTPHLFCSICNSKHRGLELHEEWSFDDVTRVQRLEEFLALCPRCHLAKHAGRAHLVGKFDEVIDHLRLINNLSTDHTIDLVTQALNKWNDRSQHEYVLDLGHLETILPPNRIHMDWIGSQHNWFGSRFESIVWAKDIIASNALIIDTETTGLPGKIPNVEIIELSMINVRGEVEFDSLFKPSSPIQNADIHSITDKKVQKAPAIAEKWSEICNLMEGRTIVTYNARFDREVFHTTAEFYGLNLPDCKWHCAMQAWWTFNNLPYTKLPNSKHRALGDARAALALIQEMATAISF